MLPSQKGAWGSGKTTTGAYSYAGNKLLTKIVKAMDDAKFLRPRDKSKTGKGKAAAENPVRTKASIAKSMSAKPSSSAQQASSSSAPSKSAARTPRFKRLYQDEDEEQQDDDHEDEEENQSLALKAQLLKAEEELQRSKAELKSVRAESTAKMNECRDQLIKEVEHIRELALGSRTQSCQMTAATSEQAPTLRPIQQTPCEPMANPGANQPGTTFAPVVSTGKHVEEKEEVSLWKNKYDEEKACASALSLCHSQFSDFAVFLQAKNTLLQVQQEAAMKHEAEQKEWHSKLLESQVCNSKHVYLSSCEFATSLYLVADESSAIRRNGKSASKSGARAAHDEHAARSGHGRGQCISTCTAIVEPAGAN